MIIRRPILWALLVLALMIAAIAAFVVSKAKTSHDIATDGPFRDGIYLGTLDAKSGRTPAVAVGRWSRDSDRQSFAAGYEAAFRQARAVLNQNNESAPNTSAAYRDGLYLGKRDAEQGRAEHASVARWTQGQDKELFAFGYHQAFLNEMARLSARGQMVQVSLRR